MRKLALFFLLCLLIFPLRSFADPSPSGRLIILQTNDVYRIRAVDEGRRGGLARLAALVASERRGLLPDGPDLRFALIPPRTRFALPVRSPRMGKTAPIFVGLIQKISFSFL